LGISNRHHFAWLTEALEAFERETGRLAAIRQRSGGPTLWCLAAPRLDPPLEYLTAAIGAHGTRVALFDKFPTDASVTEADLNDLRRLPDGACDVLTLLRASYFIAEPATFLAEARRLVRPGGLLVVDWLHGLSDAPILDLRGDPRYGGGPTPFTTTYADPQMLAEFPEEFGAFIRHLNRPPAWANIEQPGAPLPLRTRLARALGGGPRRRITPGTYLDACRAELAAAGKHLIEPALMEQYFKVLFRHARYFYPFVRKFNLYLLTVLEPVGGSAR
jgi:SAM-dependent methyltransferase